MASPPSGVRFFKLSGGGNDFIAVLEPDFLTPGHAEALSARGHSLGADGVFLLEPVGESDEPSVRMTYLNADGSRAGLCVNGTRCAALLAFHLGWASERVTIDTGAGAIRGTRIGESTIGLELAAPTATPVERRLEVDGQTVQGWFIDTGVPHFVLEWPDNLVGAPVAEWGSEIRLSPQFENGANVDFVRFTAPDRLELRTFERGVEGETLACGSGVLAAAAVAVHLGRCGLPLHALTSGGFSLSVDGKTSADGAIREWTLAGDARLVAEGALGSGALSIPEPPLWTD